VSQEERAFLTQLWRGEVWEGSKTSQSSAKEQLRGTLLLPAFKPVQPHMGQSMEKQALRAGDPGHVQKGG